MERDFLTVTDLSTEELEDVLDLALTLKQEHRAGQLRQVMGGRVLGLVFHKPSLRTRVSFESGFARMGGQSVYLSNAEVGMGTRETIADISRVLCRYVDAVMIRTFSHQWVEEMAQYSTVPIINGLTDDYHPCQILADLLTIKENFDDLKDKHIVFVGDGNNVAKSWMNAVRRLPIRFTLSAPEGFVPEPDFMNVIHEETGDRVRIEPDPHRAVADADVIYTDVWASMGQEHEAAARAQAFAPYQINDELLDDAPEHAILLHCLPAHRDEEITDSVIEGPRSRVFDEAENRMHAQNALLVRLMAEGWS